MLKDVSLDWFVLRYFPGVARIIIREHFHPRGLFHQIKLNFAPFNVVVYLISIDSGGDFLTFSLDGFLLEPHAMELTQLNKLKRQLFYRAFIRTLLTGCAAALEQRGQRFKGGLCAHAADAAAVLALFMAVLSAMPVRSMVLTGAILWHNGSAASTVSLPIFIAMQAMEPVGKVSPR